MPEKLNKLLESIKEKALRKGAKFSSTGWYSDRYQLVTVQRNTALVLTFSSIVIILLTIFAIITISTSKSIEPFVIEVEDKSGVVNVIRPFVYNELTANEALRKYFLLKYINARETYNYNDFRYNYFTVVRALSNEQTYTNFRIFTNSSSNDNPISFGAEGKVTITIRSVTHLTAPPGTGYLAQVIFVKETTSKSKNTVENKVALISYDYYDKKMNDDERMINPLGFQITAYKLDNYTLN